MAKRKKIIIFDGDDTLWRTQELYDSKKKQFKDLMHAQGFMENDIIEQMDQLDAERVEILKFSRKRFLESMLIVYAALCGKHNKKWNISTESKIRKLGQFAYLQQRGLYADASKTLETLSGHFYLILVTAGKNEIQRNIIEGFGREFKSYFLKIYTPEIKTVKEFKKIFNELKVQPKNVWVIGNSIRSDINPALRVGANAILISRRTWKYDEERIITEKVNTATSLTAAAKIILKKEKVGGNLL